MILLVFLAQTLRIIVPYLLAAAGGVMSERVGVIALTLEGFMLTGAFTAAVGSYYLGGPWAGMACGLLLAFAASRLLRSFVFGITPHDPLTFAVVAGVLAVVAILASYIPARRATRIDPLEALRG